MPNHQHAGENDLQIRLPVTMYLEQEDRPHIMWSPSRSVCVCVCVCGGGGGERGGRSDFLLNCTVIANARSLYDAERCIPLVISQSQLTLMQNIRFKRDI
jgi:hypothetical protein